MATDTSDFVSGQTTFGLLEFSTNTVNLTPNGVVSLSEFVPLAQNTPQTFGITATGTALNTTISFVLNNAPQNALPVVILLTDGRTSTRNQVQLAEALVRLAGTSIETIAIGAGSNTDGDELTDIAQGDANNAFVNVPFSSLADLNPEILNRLAGFCNPKGCPTTTISTTATTGGNDVGQCGLVSDWPLDDITGFNSVVDTVTTRLGVILGGAQPSGPPLNGLTFQRSEEQLVFIPPNTDIYSLSDGAVSMTVCRGDTGTTRRTIIDRNSPNGGEVGQFVVFLEGGEVVARFRDTSSTTTTLSGAMPTGECFDLFFSWGNRGLGLRLNTLLVDSLDSVTAGQAANTQPISIGADFFTDATNGFEGTLSNFRVWDTSSLSTTQSVFCV